MILLLAAKNRKFFHWGLKFDWKNSLEKTSNFSKVRANWLLVGKKTPVTAAGVFSSYPLINMVLDSDYLNFHGFSSDQKNDFSDYS